MAALAARRRGSVLLGVPATVLLLLLAPTLLEPWHGVSASRPIPVEKEPMVPKRSLKYQAGSLEPLWKQLGDHGDTLSMFSGMLADLLDQESDLEESLASRPRRLTLLAPTNEAWLAFFGEIGVSLHEFVNHTEALQDIMLYHIHRDSIMLPYLSSDSSLTMANDIDVSFARHWDGQLVIRDAAGRTTGFWHDEEHSSSAMAAWREAQAASRYPPQVIVIDRVLFPVRPGTVDEALSYNSEFGLFHQALYDGNFTELLETTDANVTLLVPTDDAFEAGLRAMQLTYDELMDDAEMLTAVISAHALPGVHDWGRLHSQAFKAYHESCNSCSQFRVVEHYAGDLTVMGASSTRNSNATITEADLVAGNHALIHKVSAMLLPLIQLGNHQCRVSCAVVRPDPQ